MSHVTGSITTRNSPIVGGSGTADVPFILPANTLPADVDLANAKVSLNGNVQLPANCTVTLVTGGPTGNQFHLLNTSAKPWPAVSSLVVQAPVIVPPYVGMSPYEMSETLVDHESRLP